MNSILSKTFNVSESVAKPSIPKKKKLSYTYTMISGGKLAHACILVNIVGNCLVNLTFSSDTPK